MPNRLLFVRLSLSLFLFACTTKTVIEHRSGAPAEASADATDPAPPALADPSDGATEDDPEADPPSGSDAGAPPPAKPDDAGPASADASDASPPAWITGGAITVTCPASGFHEPDPVSMASLPSSLLPRCSAATKTCAYGAATAEAYDACLAADTTPPGSLDGEDVDCTACDRTQGSYCLASACRAEFAAYACCAQANGEAACATYRSAMLSCAGGSGKAAFDACIASLVGACFP